MYLVISLHLCFILSTLGQELSYIPEYLHSERPQVHDYTNQLIQDGLHTHHYGQPVKLYSPKTSPSLSKLYKPRPAELDKILMGYHDQINTLHLKPKHSYRPEHPKQSRIQKTISQLGGKHYYERPEASHSPLSAQKEYADYYKKAFYSKIKPAYVSRISNYDGNYGYKTAEVVSEEDPEYNYDFSYSVSHPEYNLNFGHKEDKRGKLTKGIYYALLPDGRTQYVEYEADEKGYKPRITYDNHNNRQYR